MSEEIEEELKKYKDYLINEYRSNGGKKDLSEFTLTMIQNELENQKKVNALRQEIEDLKKTKNVPKDMHFAMVDQGRENAALAKRLAAGVRGTVDYMYPPFDVREIDDERFKRDNAVNKVAPVGQEHSVVILRDDDGRMA